MFVENVSRWYKLPTALLSVIRNSFYLQYLPTGLDKQNFQRKIENIFLPVNFSICFGCLKEPSH